MPASAVWAGGRDGGTWIECRPLNAERYDCTNYYEDSGAVWYRGVFEYVGGRQRAQPPDTLRYSHFNGIRILLADENGSVNGWLSPVEGASRPVR